MDTKLHRTSDRDGTIPEAAVVVGVLIFCALIYGFASGSGSSRYMESDRSIVLDCWSSLERRLTRNVERESLVEGCERLERGFKLKYGTAR